jgi:multiple sugar transport system substrate-binding protein
MRATSKTESQQEESSMNKTIARLAAATVLALVLGAGAAGCGDDDKGDEKSASSTSTKPKAGTQIRLWIMNNGPHPVADTERIVKPFEQQTGVDVKVQLVGWDVQFDRIRNAAVSGQGPDVTQAGTTQVPFFAALGGFADIGGRVGEIGGAEAYAPGVWKTTQVVGRKGTYAVPWFTEARAIYYRKDALARAGVDPATAFKNWDSLKAALQKLKSVRAIGGQKIMPFGGPGKKAFDLVHHIAPFVWDAGGAELSADNKTSTIDSAQARQGVDFMAGLVQDGVFDKSMLERDGQGVEDQFKAGRLAVWIGGPWVLASVKRADDTKWGSDTVRQNIGVAPMPAGPSGKAYTFVGGSNMMVFKSSKHQNEAWALIKYLSSDAVQTQYAELMGMFPSRLAPQEQTGKTDADHEAFYQAIQQGRTYAPVPQWAQIENAYKTRFGEILDIAAGLGGKQYNEDTVGDELKKAKDEADTLLAQSS